MAKKETSKKQVKKKKPDTKDMAIEKIREGIDELHELSKKVKERFDKADSKTKKQIMAGVAGAAALLGGIIGAS